MALQKQQVNLNFLKGLDTKSDPYQLDLGNFKSLVNSVFSTTGRLTKRNGFKKKTSLPNSNQTVLTTYQQNLVATGSNLLTYNQSLDEWIDKGTIQPVDLSVISITKATSSQTNPDIAISSNGIALCVYEDSAGGSYYQIVDTATGQQIIPPSLIASTASNPRAFLLDRYFIITFTATVGTPHLQYISIPLTMVDTPSVAQDISTTIPSLDVGYDGYVINNTLYIAYSDAGPTVQLKRLSNSLVLSAASILVGQTADLVSVTADTSTSTPTIYVSYWDSTSQDGYTASFTNGGAPLLAPTQIINNTGITHIISYADNDVCNIVYENYNEYQAPYPVSSVQTDYISTVDITSTGVVGSTNILLRSVGLAAKPLIDSAGNAYFMVAYGEINQPTYFLINSDGVVLMRLAYSNGGGYASSQVLPSVPLIDGIFNFPYEFKDFLTTVNKSTITTTPLPEINAIYTQTGINLAKFQINVPEKVYSSEISDVLNLTGGQLWQFDGVKPFEYGFQVWPENIAITTATGSGGLTAQEYFYQFTYEWTDNQGNLYRSAPSIPQSITTTTPNSTNTIYVPTLRITSKPTSIRIVGYRWSTAQQTYYQFTSVVNPVLNDPSVDFVVITDDLSDSDILGQTLLYTTGGVLENIAPPANKGIALYKNRVFLINAENPDELWYSKQVIQNVPVEMSDLLTLYIAPTTGAQGSTGPTTAISAMDDKLIIFKKDAIYYVTGTGPDNTGANNDFSDPIYITSSVGCDNPNSIVLMPQGIMFQSDKGIWLLGRDLSTKYIGDAVEAYNSIPVKSALTIPGTNQVRFTLNNSVTLMYDYYYNQWGTFTNIRAVAATLYEGLHTYLNSFGQVFQEAPGTYMDGSSPVLMSFTTAWINVAGLQGYERFYFCHLLGTYYTPFKLNMTLAYDYNVGKIQNIIVTPDNVSENWGDDPLWGSGVAWGGPGNVFEARVFPITQKCESFQITIDEAYDSTKGILPGAGLTLSGLNLTVGLKKGYRTNKPSRSFG